MLEKLANIDSIVNRYCAFTTRTVGGSEEIEVNGEVVLINTIYNDCFESEDGDFYDYIELDDKSISIIERLCQDFEALREKTAKRCEN
jgi:hypothetical protein